MLALHQFIVMHRAELIARTRAKVAQRSAPKPTEQELASGVPLFLDQLVDALKRVAPPSAEMTETIGLGAAVHGGAMLRRGFTVAQVVHDYGDVCQAVTELAEELRAPITTEEFHTLNQCIDNAMAQAVTEYMRERDRSVADREKERTGVFAHELRDRLTAATFAFAMIKNGSAPLDGAVAGIVTRNLHRLKGLIDRSLIEVRLEAKNVHPQRISMLELLEDAELDGAMEARVRKVSLSVVPAHAGIDVDADPQILAGAVANLLQNAIKFTRPGGHILLRSAATAERVQIEIEDECGGLPPGKEEELFGAFQQRGTNRSGLGLGLFISRRGVEASGGVISVRNMPARGCVFSIDLPRMPAAG